jgi:hypothetical protein
VSRPLVPLAGAHLAPQDVLCKPAESCHVQVSWRAEFALLLGATSSGGARLFSPRVALVEEAVCVRMSIYEAFWCVLNNKMAAE